VTRDHQDLPLALAALALIGVGLTLGYAPWVLASVVLATIVLLTAALARAKPGLAARRAGGLLLLAALPAALQAYVYYPSFLRAWNPHHTILPLTHANAWHPTALSHYPALLATLAGAGAALLCTAVLTYWHVAQRRAAAGDRSWPQVGDHSGQYPVPPAARQAPCSRP